MLTDATRGRIPDILDCIANLDNDRVFTPPRVANEVLDLLPPEVWADPNLRFLDPACKTGIFLREIARRLMNGLAEAIPDEEERRLHIFGKMLYGVAVDTLTSLMSRRTLYYSKGASGNHSVVKMPTSEGSILFERMSHSYKGGHCEACGAPEGNKTLDRGEQLENYAYQFIHAPEVFDSMKFDVVIGNPPYQIEDAGFGVSATPIYHRFVQQAFSLKPRYVAVIIPSRWFAGGKGLDKFRAEMLQSRRFRHLVDFPDASEVFSGMEIKGGVCYFLWDEKYDDACEIVTVQGGRRSEPSIRLLGEHGNVFVRFAEGLPIIEKVEKRGDGSFSARVSKRYPFGTMYSNFSDFADPSDANAIQIYTSKGVNHVLRSKVTRNKEWVDEWKLLLPKAYGAGNSYPHQIIGRPLLASPGSCCTQTYLVVGPWSDRLVTENAEAFLKTRFTRFLVAMRKNTQDIRPDLFAFVPDLDMSIKWTDEMLYARYGITEGERAFIESIVREMPGPNATKRISATATSATQDTDEAPQ